MWPMGAAGLTTANSASSILNFFLLFLFLRRKVGPLGGRQLLASIWRVTLASALAGMAVWPFGEIGLWAEDGQLLPKVGLLALAGIVGGSVFVLSAWLLQVEELRVLIRRLLRRT